MQSARSVGDAFKDLYSDPVVLRGEHRFHIQRDLEQHTILLTVNTKSSAEAASTVQHHLNHILISLLPSFGVKYRFEVQ